MVQTEENRTIILRSTLIFLQSSTLSIKEPKQNVVPQALVPPSAKPGNFLMLFKKKWYCGERKGLWSNDFA